MPTLCHPLKSTKRFVYGVLAMAEENGKAKIEDGEVLPEITVFEPTLRAFAREIRKMGPFTEEDERFFQIMDEEFGGHD